MQNNRQNKLTLGNFEINSLIVNIAGTINKITKNYYDNRIFRKNFTP